MCQNNQFIHHHVAFPSLDNGTRLLILCPMIGGCQVNVERSEVGLDRREPGVTWSARCTIPVSWERDQAGLKSSTVVDGRIGTCNVAKELETVGSAVVAWLTVTSVPRDVYPA